MSRKALCLLACLVAGVAWSALLLDVVLGDCPNQTPYNRQCLETVPICAGPQLGCTSREQKDSYPGQFGCKYNEDTKCVPHSTQYADCYMHWVGCIWDGGACVHHPVGMLMKRLIKTTKGC